MARRAGPGPAGAISDVDVWDDEGRYLAHRAQAMFIRGVAGEPPVVDASGRLITARRARAGWAIAGLDSQAR